jgi:hypothetical protein
VEEISSGIGERKNREMTMANEKEKFEVHGEQYSPMEGVVREGYREGDSGYVRENKGTFFARLEGRFAPSDLLKIRLAYMLAKYGHRGQERKELDREGRKVRYFEHVRRVALILMDTPALREVVCPEAICIALLHDVLEDTEDISAEMLEMMFGKDVTLGVMAMTKRKGLSTREYQSGLMGHRIAKWVKLCDRVDNMRHCRIEYVGEEFRVKQKVETREEWMDWFRMVGGENHPLVLELWEMVKKS